jgi:hypothetical protein
MVALSRDWLDDPRLDLADRDEIEACAACSLAADRRLLRGGYGE